MQSFIRNLLKIGGGALAARGLTLDDGQIETLIGAIAAIFGVLWTVWSKRGQQPKDASLGENVPSIIAFALLTGSLAIGLMFTMGCASISEDGPYQGDQVLYNADRSIVGAYDVLHTFVKWEFENRHALTQYPEITQAADHVRRNAQRWISSASVLRDAYKANPSDEARTELQQALDTLQAALSEATRYLQAQNAP